jgi:hypothetical protein
MSFTHVISRRISAHLLLTRLKVCMHACPLHLCHAGSVKIISKQAALYAARLNMWHDMYVVRRGKSHPVKGLISTAAFCCEEGGVIHANIFGHDKNMNGCMHLPVARHNHDLCVPFYTDASIRIGGRGFDCLRPAMNLHTTNNLGCQDQGQSACHDECLKSQLFK